MIGALVENGLMPTLNPHLSTRLFKNKIFFDGCLIGSGCLLKKLKRLKSRAIKILHKNHKILSKFHSKLIAKTFLFLLLKLAHIF